MANTEETAVRMNLLRRHKQTAGAMAADITSQFDEVYRAYLRPVYAFVAFRVGNRAAAEDITAQVFEKAWRGYPRFDPRKAAISTWLFTIARNSLTDHYRSAGRKTDEVELPDDLGTGAESDPVPRLEALELRRELNAALTSLEPRELEIVSLKFGGAMTNRDISTLLQISESNVGTILYRSLKKMKTRIEGGIKND